MFIGALYSDLQASFAPGGGLVFGTGRNGRLHVTEPDGSMHGNHPYLQCRLACRLESGHIWQITQHASVQGIPVVVPEDVG
jgi:hypothetical protein